MIQAESRVGAPCNHGGPMSAGKLRLLTAIAYLGLAASLAVLCARPVRFAGNADYRVKEACSPDGTRLASLVYKTISLVDGATGKELAALKGEEFGFSCLAFSPDGATLAAAYRHGIRLWDA